VEERLQALERRLRRRTFIELAVFVLFTAVVGFGFYSVDYSVESLGRDVLALHEGLATGIKSQQLLLLDQKGEVRGYITGAEGRGVLMLLDGHGKTRIVADAGANQPALELLDGDGRAAISLLLDPLGNSVLIRSGNGDSLAAIQAVVGEAGPRVRLLGDEGQEVGTGF
jgi:hypothetical protein